MPQTKYFGGPSLAFQPQRYSAAGFAGDGGNGPLFVCTGRSTAATQGSPAVFPKWAFEELKTLPQGKGGGILLKKYPERLRTVNIRDRYELQDVDRPEDLVELLEQR